MEKCRERDGWKVQKNLRKLRANGRYRDERHLLLKKSSILEGAKFRE